MASRAIENITILVAQKCICICIWYAQFSTWQRFEVLSWKGFEHSTNLISFFLVWMKMFFFTYLSSLSSNDMLPSFESSLFWITFLLKLNIRKFQLVNSPAYCLWGGSPPAAGTGKPHAQYSCPRDSSAFVNWSLMMSSAKMAMSNFKTANWMKWTWRNLNLTQVCTRKNSTHFF